VTLLLKALLDSKVWTPKDKIKDQQKRERHEKRRKLMKRPERV